MTKQGPVKPTVKHSKAHQAKEEEKSRREQELEEARQQREDDREANRAFSNSMREFSRFQKEQMQMQLQQKMSKQMSGGLDDSASNPQAAPPIFQQSYSWSQQPHLPLWHQQLQPPYTAFAQPTSSLPQSMPTRHPTPQPIPQPTAPLIAKRSESQRSSSPIAVDDEIADEAIRSFITWKLERAIGDTRRNRVLLLHQLIEQEEWKEEDLRAMHNADSAPYRIAYKAGLPDRMIRDIKKDLAVLKPSYRATKTLMAIQGGEP